MIHWSRRLAVILFLAMASGASAQAGQLPQPAFPAPQLMAGYVGSAPGQLLGGAVAWLPPFLDGWGLYLDYKVDPGSPANDDHFLSGLTAETAEGSADELRTEEASYASFNAALVRAFRDDLVLYLGGGVSEETVYGQFYDPTLERGTFGSYWAQYEDAGGPTANVMGGIFFRLARHVTAQFGAQSLPAGVTVGLLLTL